MGLCINRGIIARSFATLDQQVDSDPTSLRRWGICGEWLDQQVDSDPTCLGLYPAAGRGLNVE